MIEFGKRNSGTEKASPFEGMTGFELLERFYMRGLQPHFQRAEQIEAFRHDSVKEDSDAINDIVKAIQIEINGLSDSNAGSKVTRDDVERYLKEKIRNHEE